MEKRIQDNVHGSIEVPFVCLRIIDTPIFKRLKKLKQLGVSDHVYPGASHSRFEHSIGVMHMGGKYCDILMMKYPGLISAKDKLCVQIAGLCHDLGHGPFSHLWEEFVRLSNPEGPSWSHEQTSLALFDRLVAEEQLTLYLDPGDIHFIKELINGPLGENGQYIGREPEKTFLYELISNKFTDIDVDKWDYFQRDRVGAGVVNKGFDHNRLMHNTMIAKMNNGSYRLCYHAKTISEVMDMWALRSYMHRNVYQHRVVKTIERMLLDAFLCADEHIQIPSKDGRCLKLSEMHTDLDCYINVSDDWILGEIKLKRADCPSALEAKDLIDRIDRRDLYVTIAVIMDVPNINTVDVEKNLKDICHEAFPENPPDMCPAFKIIKMGKGERNPVMNCLFYEKLNLQENIFIEENKLLEGASLEMRLKENAPEKIETRSLLIFAKSGGRSDEANHCAKLFHATYFPECIVDYRGYSSEHPE